MASIWEDAMISIQKNTDQTLGALEITPLIDIVFIVIVFLLVTANTPLLTLPVNVPAADQESILVPVSSDNLTITINANKPYWHIGTDTFDSWNEFKKSLLAITSTSETALTIAVDKAAPTEPLLKLLSLLNQQNISDAKIIMEQSRE
jgi:biopolymer transport protein ExbD